MRPKILFLRACLDREEELAPPLAMLFVAAAFRDAGAQVTFLDARIPPLSMAQTLRACRDAAPDIIAMQCFSGDQRNLHAFFAELKAAVPARLLVGGVHVDADPIAVLRDLPAVDYIMCGDVHSAAADYLAWLEAPGQGDLPGLGWRDGEEVRFTPPPRAADGPEALTWPYRPWLEAGQIRYRSSFGEPADLLLTARGCPHRCSFCGRPNGAWRCREPEAVVEETQWLWEHGVRHLVVVDDTFAADRDRCLAILEGILRRNLRFIMAVRSRADTVDPELLRVMKRAGVHRLQFGMESGSEVVLQAINKGTTPEQNEQACMMVKAAGLECDTMWVAGTLAETPETLAETERFVARVKPTSAHFFPLLPLLGTYEYNTAAARGWLRGGWSINDERPWVQLPWMMCRADLEQRVARLNTRFRSSWHYGISYAWKNRRRLRGRHALGKVAGRLVALSRPY